MSATSFDTQRLERLAGYLHLEQLDTLPIGISNTYSYRQRPLTIRKNQWGEIEHIGLLLFPDIYRKQQPLPIYDFLERYLLSRLATPANTEDAFRIQWLPVHINVGTTTTALQIDTLTEFKNEYVDLRAYRASWSKDGKKILELSFSMNYQLLTGCDAPELENRFLRHLKRYQLQPSYATTDKQLPQKGTYHVWKNSYYMSPMVRNDIFYMRASEKEAWQLVDDAKQPTKTICNWMVAPDSDNQLPLQLTIDKYGYKVDSVQTTYRAWQQICLSEGCQPYYGLKTKREDVYECSVFMVNRKGGYVHLLSINIPEAALHNRKEVKCFARMYAYIPLYNVDAQLLHNTEYEPIK